MEEGTHPIVFDSAVVGKLTVSRQGPRTVFDAWCRPMEGIVRISVYGGGREGCLGVLAPEGDGLTLRRRFSRAELQGFPQVIERVGRAGEPAYPEGAACPLPQAEAPEPPEIETVSEPEQTAEAAAQPDSDCAADTETAPAAVPEDAAGLNWYASPDGALVCFDGTHNLIALPEGDERIPAGKTAQRRSIEGKDYLVYITIDGRIV